MQTGKIKDFVNINYTPPNHPYIDCVYNICNCKVYHVCNHPEIEWTAYRNEFKHYSDLGEGAIWEITPDMYYQSVQLNWFGRDITAEMLADSFNKNRGQNELY